MVWNPATQGEEDSSIQSRMRKTPPKKIPKRKKKPVVGNVREIKKVGIDCCAAQYATLAAMGFTPDANGWVLCGKAQKTDGPCTTVCFYPMTFEVKGKKVLQLHPTVTSRAITDTNRLHYFKLLQPKKYSPNAPRLWDTEERFIDGEGRESVRKLEPTAQWPFHGRPSQDFLVVESIKGVADTGDPHQELATLKEYLADIVTASIVTLDPSPIVRLGKCVEALKELQDNKIEAEKTSQRRNAVMNAFRVLCLELRHPPTKQQLREKAGLKVEGGRPGSKKEMDDKQFTREFINALGLHWLPEADHNRR